MRRLIVFVAALFVLGPPVECLAKTFVLPHVLEVSGRITDTQFTFDTQIFVTYTGGLPGAGKGKRNGAALDLYLYGDDGSPMRGKVGDVCNPCQFEVSTTNRKLSLTLEDHIDAAGGFPPGQLALRGFGVIVIRGDAGHVAVQGFVVNSHTSAFDLSVFGFDPVPITAAP